MESIEQINYIKSSSEQVYNVLTTEEGLARIWTKKLKVKPIVGFINEFDFDEGYINKIKVRELVENSSIVWDCIDSDEEWVGTSISFHLSETDGLTTVRLSHSGWREKTDYYAWCSYNWAMFLYRLKKYCETLSLTSLENE